MQIDVYATRDCFYCYQMKELLKRAELEYNLIHVMKEGVSSNNKGENYMSKEEFKHVYPHTRGFPYVIIDGCLLYTSPSPRDRQKSRMPSSA